MHELIALSTALNKKDFAVKLCQRPQEIFRDSNNRSFLQVLKEMYAKYEDISYEMIFAHIKLTNVKLPNGYTDKLLLTNPSLNSDALLIKLDKIYNTRHILERSEKLKFSVLNGEMSDVSEIAQEILDIACSKESDGSKELSEYSEIDIDEIYPSNSYHKSFLDLLNDAITGFFNGQYITVAAPPGGGKSTFAFQDACESESSYFSLEMDKIELYAKHLSSIANVDSNKFWTKDFSVDELRRVKIAKEQSKKLKIKVYDDMYNIHEILNAIKEDVLIHGKKKIYVDYIQLITGAPGTNPNQQLEYISRSFKKAARKLKVPIIVLSQFSKEGLREGQRPTSAHLRNSGAMWNDSDIVLILWENDNQFVLTVDKGRRCKTGDIMGIYFDKQFSRFNCSKTSYNNDKTFDSYKTFE